MFLGFLKSKFKKISSIFHQAIHILKHCRLSGKSAELTFVFILSIVPFLSVLFTFIHSLNGFESLFNTLLTPIILKHFGDDAGNQIIFYLREIIKNIQVKELGIVSFSSFTITVIFLFLKVEELFNSLMSYKSSISFYRRLMKCWVILTFLPFAFAAAVMKSDQLLNYLLQDGKRLLDPQFIHMITFFTSFFVQTIIFFVMYYTMPSKTLNFKSNFIGSLVASLLFEILQYVNKIISSNMISGDPSQIYGSVPILVIAFFVWARLAWTIVLIGMAFAIASQRVLYVSHSRKFLSQK